MKSRARHFRNWGILIAVLALIVLSPQIVNAYYVLSTSALKTVGGTIGWFTIGQTGNSPMVIGQGIANTAESAQSTSLLLILVPAVIAFATVWVLIVAAFKEFNARTLIISSLLGMFTYYALYLIAIALFGG